VNLHVLMDTKGPLGACVCVAFAVVLGGPMFRFHLMPIAEGRIPEAHGDFQGLNVNRDSGNSGKLSA
jgi:hypothetical protein